LLWAANAGKYGAICVATLDHAAQENNGMFGIGTAELLLLLAIVAIALVVVAGISKRAK
jgi:hypothetical protein